MKFLMICKKKSRKKNNAENFLIQHYFFLNLFFIQQVYTSGSVPLTSAISSQPKLKTS